MSDPAAEALMSKACDEITRLRDALQTALSERDEARKYVEHLQGVIEDIQTRKTTTAEHALSALREENERLKALQVEQCRMLTEGRAEVEQWKDEAVTLSTEIGYLKIDLEGLQSRLADAERFVDAFMIAYPNIRQLQDGFSSDASWSEWDQSVREETMRLGTIAAALSAASRDSE